MKIKDEFNPFTQTRTQWVADQDNPQTIHTVKTFDATEVVEYAKSYKNQVNQSGKVLRKLATVPAALYFHLMKTGQLGEHTILDGGGLVVDKKKFNALFGRYGDYEHLSTSDEKL